MIEILRNDEIINKVGGRFRLTALIQRRWLQLMHGARPMVDTTGLSEMEVILKEIVEGKIEAYEPSEEAESEEPAEL